MATMRRGRQRIRATGPYGRAEPAGAGPGAWEADPRLEPTLRALALELTAAAPGQSISAAELGDKITTALKRKGVHPKRDGKIGKLSLYMRVRHGGWTSYLAQLALPGLRYDAATQTLAAMQRGSELASGGASGADAAGPRLGSAPRARSASCAPDVDELDLSKL